MSFTCTGVFEDKRLVIVVTKFDQVHESKLEDYTEEDSTGDEITEERVKAAACESVSKVCHGAEISPDNVIPVSGKWAYHARMLANCLPHEPAYHTYRKNVEESLDKVPNATCGQEERPSTSFVNLEHHELSAKLEEASRITMLEAR